MSLKELIGRKVNIVCVFGDKVEPIFYSGKFLELSEDEQFVKILDKYKKIIILNVSSIKQIKILEDDAYGG